MRRTYAGIAILALVLAVGGSAMAEHTEPCNGTVTPVVTPAGTFYIDDRDVSVGGVWIYQESNGVEGLQSGGESAILGAEDVDACYAVAPEGEEHPTPDTLLI